MQQEKLPTLHLTIMFLLLGITLFLFYITQNEITLLSRTQAEANQLVSNQAKLEELKSQLPGYRGQYSNWIRSLPANENDVADFASQIEQVAKANNLAIDITFDDFPGPVDILGRYIAGLGATLALQGSYSGVSSFLNSLNNLPYYFKIDKMTITKPEAKTGVKAVFNGALMMNQKI